MPIWIGNLINLSLPSAQSEYNPGTVTSKAFPAKANLEIVLLWQRFVLPLACVQRSVNTPIPWNLLDHPDAHYRIYSSLFEVTADGVFFKETANRLWLLRLGRIRRRYSAGCEAVSGSESRAHIHGRYCAPHSSVRGTVEIINEVKPS
jgi:hypothetical protein